MSGPKARGTGVIDRQTLRQYEATKSGFVIGGVLTFHSTDGFAYDLTLDIFREQIAEGCTIVLNPHDLMYEMCALGLYDIGMEVGQRVYGDDWGFVYKRMNYWATKHWTVARDTTCSAGQLFDQDEVWGLMLVSMREELRAQLKKYHEASKGLAR